MEEEKKTENHPDFKGSMEIGGKEFWVSGWKKKSKDGKKMISLAIDPKQPKTYQPPPKREEQSDVWQ